MTLSAEIVERQPLSGGGGLSGNTLERVRLQDGRELVLKRVDPDDDWISRATGDRGRLVAMAEHGVLDRIPAVVDHTIVAVEPDDDGWSVFMRDASPALLPSGTRVDRATVGRVLGSMATVHDAFWGEPLPDLCSIEDRYHLLSPRTIERELALGNSADGITRGWEAFWAGIPTEIAAVMMPLVEDPIPIGDQLRTGEQTLIHGDLRLDNLGLTDDGIVLLDWGERTGPAPPAVELMWFLGFDALLFDCPRDEVIADFVALYDGRVDERALDLAFIGGLVHLGCHFGLGMLGRSPTIGRLEGDGATRHTAAVEELAWWIHRVAAALERSSPI